MRGLRVHHCHPHAGRPRRGRQPRPCSNQRSSARCHQRMTTVVRLQTRLEQVARRGRPGWLALRHVLDLRTPTLAAAESELELLLWQILRRHRLPLPERQVEVTVGGRNYRLDLAYRAERIFIEGDGFGVHSPRSRVRVRPHAPEQAGGRRLGPAAFHLAARPPVGGATSPRTSEPLSSCAARRREAMLLSSRPGIRRLHNSVTDNPVARRPGCPHRS